jgi:hypothetical protein
VSRDIDTAPRTAIRAHPKQTDFSYTAGLAVPLFGLAGHVGDLMAAAFHHLGPFGLKASDAKVDTPWAQPADLVMTCALLDLGVMVRFRLTEVEIWSRNQEFARGPAAIPIIEASLAAVQDFTSKPAAPATHVINVISHGTLEQTDVRGFIREHVLSHPARTTAGLKLEPFGCTYEVSPEPNIRFTVDLQRSLLFPSNDSAFLRLMALFGGQISPAEACRRFTQYLAIVLSELGIEVHA